MRYVDTVQLATATTDGYGDKTITALTDCRANFMKREAVPRVSNMKANKTETSVYLDPTNAVVLANIDDLEGMFLVADLFGGSIDNSWYRISHATVAQRKLLDNKIDNVFCLLEKEPGVPYATYVS